MAVIGEKPEQEEGGRLARAAEHGRTADAELATLLGRPQPAGRGAGERYVEDLLAAAPPAPDVERRLVAAAQRGDPRARERLVEAFMPRIASLARLYRVSSIVERQELLQEGVAGLLAALETYDPERGTPFWAYARHHVHRAMRRLVSELARPVVLSDRALRNLGKLREAERRITAERHREPSPDELAALTSLPRERVDELLRADRAPRSTEEPLSSRGMPVGRLEDQLADPRAEEAYERLLDEIEGQELAALLSGLAERERMILRARYGDEQSPAEIAERLGLSPDRVEQIERRALHKLAAAARARGFAA
jgi:RNA polymerase sigma factor (sigma-70 family)